jgi:RNA polymerase sigma-70 factor (ECF subfamily)
MAEPVSETIRRAQAGDREAIAILVAEQQRYVYSIAMSITRDPTDAADLTQDALIRFIRSIGSYRGETKLTTWLYRLVVNLGIDRLRRRGAPPIRLDDDGVDLDVASDDPGDDVAGSVERVEQARAVRQAIERLPDAQRLALTLHYFEDMRYEDIADVMGVPLNTVKSHIRRGKERLAVLLRPELGPESDSASAADAESRPIPGHPASGRQHSGGA